MGVVVLLVGIIGFVPGVTANYDQLAFAGHHSGTLLFGVFAVSVLHNIVHLAFGVVGIGMAATVSGARTFLIVGGVIYGLLWTYGLVIDLGGSLNVVPVNTADNWLPFVLAIGMIGLGVLLTSERRRTTV